MNLWSPLFHWSACNELGAVQLHGGEDENYIRCLKKELTIPVIKAFQADSPKSIRQAEKSPADLILLDNGAGGTGTVFDWSLLRHIKRPYFLAGGLGPHNLTEAIKTVHPWGVDRAAEWKQTGQKTKKKFWRQ